MYPMGYYWLASHCWRFQKIPIWKERAVNEKQPGCCFTQMSHSCWHHDDYDVWCSRTSSGAPNSPHDSLNKNKVQRRWFICRLKVWKMSSTALLSENSSRDLLRERLRLMADRRRFPQRSQTPCPQRDPQRMIRLRLDCFLVESNVVKWYCKYWDLLAAKWWMLRMQMKYIHDVYHLQSYKDLSTYASPVERASAFLPRSS